MRNNLFEPTRWPHSSLQRSRPGPAVPRASLCAAAQRSVTHTHAGSGHSKHNAAAGRPFSAVHLGDLLLAAASCCSSLARFASSLLSKARRRPRVRPQAHNPIRPQPPALFPCVIRLCSQSILLSAIPHPHRSPRTPTLPDQSLIPLFVIQVPPAQAKSAAATRNIS
jgi:hypothetical protein